MNILLLTVFFGGADINQHAFLVVNETNRANYKMIEDDAVIAFAQTPRGRILFSPFGAFVGIPNGPDSVAVLQVGFSEKVHKRGVSPRYGTMLPTRVSRFAGPSETWHADARVPADLTYGAVWPGIDLTFVTRGPHVEFQLYLEPGADPAAIELTTGAEQLRIENGSLLARLDQAELRLSAPVAFQDIDGHRVPVAVAYLPRSDGSFGFTLGDYDAAHPVTIDPILSWSSFFGGDGADNANDSAISVAVNGSNEVIFGGETSGPNYPVTPGVFADEYSGMQDVYVGKLSSDGTTIEFLALFGSSDNDNIFDIELDASNNIFVTGNTLAADFPVTLGAYDISFDGGLSKEDGFVAKISADGSSLLYSTFLGGGDHDTGKALVVEPLGTVVCFLETNTLGLPTTMGAAQSGSAGNTDLYIVRLSADGSQFMYATYFGGSSGDYIHDAMRLSDGRLVFTGTTVSTNLPTSPGTFDATFNGNIDAFVGMLSADGTTFSGGGYIGGSDQDRAFGIGVDGSGNYLIGGHTKSSDFPTTMGAYDETFNGVTDAFIAKVSADFTSLSAATYLGAPGTDELTDLVVDSSGRPIAVGTTRDAIFPVTVGAYDMSENGGTDIFAAKLSNDLTTLVFASLLGGAGDDLSSKIALDGSDNIYGAGSTLSNDFPSTTGSLNGEANPVLFKFAADGASLPYAHIFGTGGPDAPGEIVRTPTGETILTGSTQNADFPLTVGVVDDVVILEDAFISKLNAAGDGLLFSTFLGGSDQDSIVGLTLADNGDIVVSGGTESTDFPTTPGAYDTTHNGGDDLFVTRLSADATTLVFSTYLGSTANEFGGSVAVGSDDAVYVSGRTFDGSFPTTTGAYDETYNSGGDAFVTKFNSTGTALAYSTFLGTAGLDIAADIAVDALHQAIVLLTTPGSFATTAGAYDETANGMNDGMVIKLNAAGNGLVFSTFLGGTDGDTMQSMLIGASGEIHVVGFSSSTNFPTTVGAFERNTSGDADAVVATLSSDGTSLLFGTYLGGSGKDLGYSLAFDGEDNLVVAGETHSTDFPVTGNALQSELASGDFDNQFLTVLECDGADLRFSTYFTPGYEAYGGLAGNGDGTVVLYGQTSADSFPVTTGAYDTSFDGEAELSVTEFDLSSENLFFTNKQSAVQGLNAISLEAFLPMCTTDTLTVQWFNETLSSSFPLNTNPISLTPTPTQSLLLRVDVNNTTTANTVSKMVPVLVADDSLYFDYNGDTCNDTADIRAFSPFWRTEVANDPNGDGFVDVRDFLYINTEQEGACP